MSPIEPATSWTARAELIDRAEERPVWSSLDRPAAAEVGGLVIVVGLMALLTPLGLATLPGGLLIIAAPALVLAGLLAIAGRRARTRLARSSRTVAVDDEGLHERWGSIVWTRPPSQVRAAWRHGEVAYVRLADVAGTLALDLAHLDTAERDRLVATLGSGAAAGPPAGTTVAVWTVTAADYRRAVAIAEQAAGTPVSNRPWQPWAIVLAGAAAVVLLSGSIRPVVVLAVLSTPFLLLHLLEQSGRRRRAARGDPNTLTVAEHGVVEHERGGSMVVSIPWSALHRVTVEQGEVHLVTEPPGATLVPAGAMTDEQRATLLSAVELHRPEALAG